MANRSYLNASPMSNASGRPQTNSAPTANHAYSYSRPISSTGNNHNLNQTHHYDSSTHQSKSNKNAGPIIMRNLDKPSGVGSQVRLIKNTTHTTTPSLNSSNYAVRDQLTLYFYWFCFVIDALY